MMAVPPCEDDQGVQIDCYCGEVSKVTGILGALKACG